MLRSFRLSNHGSIRREQELLLLPVYGESDQPVQTVTAIYGANASGKSTLLDGLQFMRQAVLGSYAQWEPGLGVPRRPFRLDPQARIEPSVFVVDLELDGVRHVYGFAVDDAAVREEWLHSYPERKRRIIFERTGSEIKFGSTVAAQRSRTEVLEELTRPDALFLSVASQVNFTESRPVSDWFRSQLTFRTAGLHLRRDPTEATTRLIENSQTKQTIVNLLRFADVGISDVSVLMTEDPHTAVESAKLTTELKAIERQRRYASGDVARRQLDTVRELLAGQLAMIDDRRYRKRLMFTHAHSTEPFEISEESAGTRAWLDAIRVVLRVLDMGATLLVDEIDTSLHPRLTARLLSLFQSPATNPRAAQLICTTHDTTLLSPTLGEEVLKRDQVWFTEKDDAGETSLYPLSDFKPRKGENTERRYLGGSYGAVPRIFAEDFAESVRVSEVARSDDDQA